MSRIRQYPYRWRRLAATVIVLLWSLIVCYGGSEAVMWSAGKYLKICWRVRQQRADSGPSGDRWSRQRLEPLPTIGNILPSETNILPRKTDQRLPRIDYDSTCICTVKFFLHQPARFFDYSLLSANINETSIAFKQTDQKCMSLSLQRKSKSLSTNIGNADASRTP